MKRLCLLVFILCVPFTLMAQEKTKQKEIGLRFYNFDSFGLHYKFGTNKAMWRLGGSMLGVKYSASEGQYQDNAQFSYSLGFAFGREKIFQLNKNFDIRVGADLSLRYYYELIENQTHSVTSVKGTEQMYQYGTGLRAVIGFNYTILDHLVIGAEFSPSIYYQYSYHKNEIAGIDYYEEDDSNWNLSSDITQNSLSLCIAYKFNKSKNEK